MNERTPVALTIQGKLRDGQMLVVCGNDICTEPVPMPRHETKIVKQPATIEIREANYTPMILGTILLLFLAAVAYMRMSSRISRMERAVGFK